MEIITNYNGGDKVCAEGYLDTIKSLNSTRILGECFQRNSFSYKGSTDADLKVQQLLSVTVTTGFYPRVGG